MSSKSKLFMYFTDEAVVMCLAFIGGFVDAAGYIKLFNLFTSSITGNLVVACASLYHPEGVFCRFCVSLCFAGGGGVLTTLAVQLKVVQEMNPRKVAMILFLCEALVLAVCWIIGQIYNDEIEHGSLNSSIVILVGSIMGISMGVHNAAAKETITNCPSTTVMTMTLVSLSSAASNTFNLFLAKHNLLQMHPKSQSVESYKLEEKFNDHYSKLMVAVKPLITFLIGALTGASTMHEMNFHCLFIPIFVILLFIFDLAAANSSEPSKPAAKPAALPAKGSEPEKSVELSSASSTDGTKYSVIDADTPVPSIV